MQNDEAGHTVIDKRAQLLIKSADYPLDFRQAVTAFESQYIVAALQRFGGNISLTAKHLGIARRSLQLRIRSMDIDVKQIRETTKRRLEEIMLRDEFAAVSGSTLSDA
jgi:DNA-binding NtrC family response regulator